MRSFLKLIKRWNFSWSNPARWIAANPIHLSHNFWSLNFLLTSTSVVVNKYSCGISACRNDPYAVYLRVSEGNYNFCSFCDLYIPISHATVSRRASLLPPRSYFEIKSDGCKSDSRCAANVVVNVSRFERLRGGSLRAHAASAYYVRRSLSDVIGANEEIRSRLLSVYLRSTDRSWRRVFVYESQGLDHPSPYRPGIRVSYCTMLRIHDRHRLPSRHIVSMLLSLHNEAHRHFLYLTASSPPFLHRFAIVNYVLNGKPREMVETFIHICNGGFFKFLCAFMRSRSL